MSMFRCPLCQNPLEKGEKSYTCPKNHCFDIAKEGYTYLLPVNQRNSLHPGDDKAMALARRTFLDAGHYAPLRDALCQLLTAQNPHALLDAGCGEGYYTAGMASALPHAQIAGIDISKWSLRWAAKRKKTVAFAVASSYHLPLADASVDAIVNCFSPLALEEFVRVLRPGGYLYYVVPGANHLWELKQTLYQAPYANEETESPYPGFAYQAIEAVDFTMDLQTPEVIQALFDMTPYCWKTPKEGVARLRTLKTLTVEASFRIHVFQKEGGQAE